MIEAVTKVEVAVNTAKDSPDLDIRVSGSLENHYAPKAKVILDQKPIAGSGYIALENFTTPSGVIRLAAPKSVEEFARILYESLREGDHQNLATIYIEQPKGEGLALAIRDRLSRSARGR
jgi:L-threonylcarbamoyladenylate synthase